ncbi:OmpR family signal transduction histidine kinase [Ignavibacterium album JCM 16511]|uniref:histidine kinase n=1 Tax=Ignavibacterium album (strain DSM 19864 / JCM 16511 / NBRC 101810 / Mat9-16) TaxID=945713 RepID=I0AN42_IGNAJ|nr:HAMP domain-containing sensor histidine kinase [Ignavibacterium album]AFH50399.1 OmpR family signal transduction histidine kinase [Ignavibacterium album JCM 16511]
MKKIGIILLLIIVLPIGFLIFNEIGKLNETEKVLEETYNNQLQTILFSVNQYSDDILNSWANKANELNEDDQLLKNFIRENLAIESIFFLYEGKDESAKFIFDEKFISSSDSIKSVVKSILVSNKNLISRLADYQKAGYRKLEPLPVNNVSDLAVVVFSNQNDNKVYTITGFVINPQEFVRKILLPRLQQISQENFIILVRDYQNRFIVSSTNTNYSGQVEFEKQMWLIPHYKIGIVLTRGTIQDLIRNRATNNMILIAILLLVLIAAVMFAYRAVKKELELAQLKADFVSNVSHELRTPLALISMFAETLELDRVKNDEKKKEYYSIISQEANRLGRIVNSILNFAKMEAGKRKFNFESINLNNVVENIYQTYSYHLQNKGFKFEKQLTENLPEVKADAEAISEAIINLIDNAVKYSADLKEVTLKTISTGNSVIVEVIDKGIGISPEDQKKVFDKFYRVSSGLIHNVKGTGIGLSLVKQIVDAHNGTIELVSEPGKGSTFRIILPIDINN